MSPPSCNYVVSVHRAVVISSSPNSVCDHGKCIVHLPARYGIGCYTPCLLNSTTQTSYSGDILSSESYVIKEFQNREMTTVRLYRGDITKLDVEAIVNATNESGMGCDIPGHCIDSAIHLSAGPNLREECKLLGGIPTGVAKLTQGYNLPAKYIIHVTGPKAEGKENQKLRHGEDHEMLAQCYVRCLELAVEHNIGDLAFCCLSTGIFGFDKKRAAMTALVTVRNWLNCHTLPKGNKERPRITFVLFTDRDDEIYQELFPDIFG